MPARKPAEAKRRTGRSPGRDAGGRKLPAPVVVLPAAPSAPQPPATLKETGSAAWESLWSEVPWLSPSTDLLMVLRLCQLHDRRAAMMAQLDSDGLTVAGYKGQPRPHPLLAHLSAVETELRQLEQQAGLTPACRFVLGFIEVRRASKLDEMAARRQADDVRRRRGSGRPQAG